ncbi:hypothetical protein FB565_007034 [Actinoplanes lutulentus]|uniref:Uncharacterized protein n=1 Tax=Actinoplanes lutulentus TaxID=1287878 RepID=A0A327ZB60_9ACTN|nr:hypothetical protein [Actinoplanes lutulentus]MBB2947266.1 hypothetical protein [Actinoplanes lutulentus]RAK36541.1 hypothetical protein B0I29_108131 [Actinoplanes lutulentus]
MTHRFPDLVVWDGEHGRTIFYQSEMPYDPPSQADYTNGDKEGYAFQAMLDPANGLAPGDPVRMAAAMIASVDQQPAPMRIVLGSQALSRTVDVLRKRIAGFEAQAELAASTDFPPGH